MQSRLAKELVAEFIGTFALILLGAGSGIVAGLGIGNLVSVALAHGLTIMIFAYAHGHISGSHINPAVTLGLFSAGKFPAAKIVPYILAQLAGAIVAGYVLLAVFGDPATHSNLGATLINTELGITVGTAFLLEAIGAFFLVNSVMHTAVGARAGILAPLAIGMTVTACIVFFGPLTGASVNPARTIGPAVASGAYQDIWVYLVATSLGGILAGALYRYFMEEPAAAAAVTEPAAAPASPPNTAPVAASRRRRR
jgi:MIP family channel proteins